MLIAFSGLKGSGKDTAANVLVNEYGFTKIAFADALREALLTLDPQVPTKVGNYYALSYLVKMYGWDQSKREFPEVRRLMQVFGTEVGRALLDENVWIKNLTKKHRDISKSDTRYVITDCRFENEAKFVHDALGIIIWVKRPGIKSDGHASETDVVKKYADYFLTNDESLEELEEDVRLMAHMRGFEPIASTKSS